MKTKNTIIILLSFLILSAISVSVIAEDLAVTVYNSNLGVVSETRQLEFQKGVHQLAFRDVPSSIDVNSVRFKISDKGKNVTILEQNYAYDLVNSYQIYLRYIDKEIELIDKEGNVYKGILLSSSDGNVILRDDSGGIKIIQMSNIIEVNFPSLPDGLITRPTLFWLYQSDAEGKLNGQISYQTPGMSWSAEYVGLLNADDNELDLSGWAAINNTSGKTYRDASLKLIAGDIHRAPTKRMPKVSDAMFLEATASAGFEEKPFFEYHMYTLPRKATLANKETKQISLFEPARTSVEKQYLYRPTRGTKVEVNIKFKNSQATGLGLPLPAGRVRLFKADDDGSLVLLGEDGIDHTPKNEEISLTVGEAFDIVGEEKLISKDKISKKVEEREYQIELRNHKDKAVTIDLERYFYGFWEIIKADFEYVKKDATTITANVAVPAGGSKSLKLRVRFEYR